MGTMSSWVSMKIKIFMECNYSLAGPEHMNNYTAGSSAAVKDSQMYPSILIICRSML